MASRPREQQQQRQQQRAAPTLRLMSTAQYARPHREEPLGGVPLSTTYSRGIGAIDPVDANIRCVAARREQQRHALVLQAAKAIAPERVAALQAEADAAVGHAHPPGAMTHTATALLELPAEDESAPGAARSRTGSGSAPQAQAQAEGQASADAASPLHKLATTGLGADVNAATAAVNEAQASTTAALAALSGTLSQEPRLGIRGAMVRELFSAGSFDGPFPGSKSANGLLNAEQFYAGTSTPVLQCGDVA
jgi:hypothetical protein